MSDQPIVGSRLDGLTEPNRGIPWKELAAGRPTEPRRARSPRRTSSSASAWPEVKAVKLTSDGVRAVVTTHNTVLDQTEKVVLEYEVSRMQR